MEQQTLRFRIRPDGRVEEQVQGVRGAACEQLTERIEARIGVLQQRQRTAEAYQASGQAHRQADQALGQVAQPLAEPLPHP